MINILQQYNNPPVGSIVSHLGTFNSSNNSGGFNATEELPDIWKLCDGTQINDPASPFDSQYVPQLTDDRYLRGSSSAGALGGSNTLTPDTDFAHLNDYTPPGSLTNHKHDADHNHPSKNTPNLIGGSQNRKQLGGPSVRTGTNHDHAINLPNIVFQTANPDTLTFTGTPASFSDWFLNTPVNYEPLFINCRYYMRIK